MALDGDRSNFRRNSTSEIISVDGSNDIVDFGLVIDVDGVLLRGNSKIPNAKEGIELLKSLRIPFMLLTNGGGKTEVEMAEKFSNKIGTSFEDFQVQVSHTPLRFMSESFKNGLTLALGPPNTRALMESYGFKNIVTADEYHAVYPNLWPDEVPTDVEIQKEWTERINNVVVAYTPSNWYRDLQIVCDVVRSDGYPGNLVEHQSIPLFFAGPDFEYAAEMSVPRLGAGAFLKCLEHLFYLSTGTPLSCTVLGKPHKLTYECAMNILETQAYNQNCQPLQKIYAIGDNPSTDIAGANAAGSRWVSVLVETGLFKRVANQNNDPNHPAKIVSPDFYTAVHHILASRKKVPGKYLTESEISL